MSSSEMSEHAPSPEPKHRRRLMPPALTRPRRLAAVAIAIATFGLGVGGTALALRGRAPVMIALAPAPISAMRDWSPVAVRGQVAEIYGNKFIVQDPSGRALVETGPKGDGGGLVAKSETVTVQGRFDHGFIHAVAITHADGRNDFTGPPDLGPYGKLMSWHGPDGWMHRFGL